MTISIENPLGGIIATLHVPSEPCEKFKVVVSHSPFEFIKLTEEVIKK